MPLVAAGQPSREPSQRSRRPWLLAVAIVPLLLLLSTVLYRIEIWWGGTAVFIGGRYFPVGTPWWDVCAGTFRSPGPSKVHRHVGFEQGFFLAFGDWYFTVSRFSGRPARVLPGEDVPDRLYRPGM